MLRWSEATDAIHVAEVHHLLQCIKFVKPLPFCRGCEKAGGRTVIHNARCYR